MKYLLEFANFWITEGGNAFPETSAVNREEIESVVAEFNTKVVSEILGLEFGELIGSWQQKPVSNDIDLLVYCDLPLNDIVAKLTAAGFEAKAFFGFNIVSVNFKVSSGKAVQIDLFVRPAESSREATEIFYKNAKGDKNTTKHRVYFLFAMLDSRREDIVGDYEIPTQYTGFMLRPDGLYKIKKVFKKTKYSIAERTLIAQTAEEISNFIFGEALPFTEWNTFEKVYKLFVQNPLYPNQQQVINSYLEKLKEEALPLPTGARLAA